MKTIGNEPAMAIKDVPVFVRDGGKRVEIAFQGDSADLTGHFAGLTKREQFAAMAMQGLLATGVSDFIAMDRIAERSVQQADALIEALNKEREAGNE